VELEFPDSWRLRADPALPELLRRIPGVRVAEWLFARRMAESAAA
jgi:hypothetical protein